MKKINLIKIGSDSIVDKKSKSLKEDIIRKIVEDILFIRKETGEDFIILSSGAVAKGLSIVDKSDNYIKSTLASIGQHRLIGLYDKLVGGNNIVSQILIDDKYNEKLFNSIATKNNLVFDDNARQILQFIKEESEKCLLNTIINGIKNNILTIINYNDSTSFLELNNLTDKTDNDKNTIFLSKLINKYKDETKYTISKVFYLTNTNGILSKDKETLSGYEFKNINDKGEFNEIKELFLSYIDNSNSDFGTGGMGSKIISGLECLKSGVEEIYISNSNNGLKIDNKMTKFNKKYTSFS